MKNKNDKCLVHWTSITPYYGHTCIKEDADTDGVTITGPSMGSKYEPERKEPIHFHIIEFELTSNDKVKPFVV